MTAQEIKQNLSQFTGTENYYRLHNLNLTDGAKFVADECKAWWLLDIIWSYQADIRLRNQTFQVWKLEVKDLQATVRCEDGDYNELLSQDIDYTDFPLESITLWCINNVILLPSEY